ncbi:MAG: hypothetical protein AAF587_05775 [Bacteroidota bacterium]
MNHSPSYLPFTSLFLILLLGSSCRPDIAEFENLDLLVDKEWQLVSIQRNNIEISEACNLDDVLFFTADSDFSHDQGSLDCFPNDDSEVEGRNWRFVRDYSTIRTVYVVRGNGVAILPRSWRFVNLNDTSMIWEEVVDPGDQNAIPEVRHFVH